MCALPSSDTFLAFSLVDPPQDFIEFREEHGDLSILDTRTFVSGMKTGQVCACVHMQCVRAVFARQPIAKPWIVCRSYVAYVGRPGIFGVVRHVRMWPQPWTCALAATRAALLAHQAESTYRVVV